VAGRPFPSDAGRATRLSQEHHPDVPLLTAALGCKCPRCGRGKVFDGILSVAPRCTECGLDISAQDAGDGPAVFVILLLGALVVGLAILVEVKFEPPMWLHVVLWLPVTLGGAILLLRPLKAAMIALQYRHLALGR
jgi:uncharacterized protein (DUF983 family)